MSGIFVLRRAIRSMGNVSYYREGLDMKRILFGAAIIFLFASSADSQTTANAQANASANADASAGAGQASTSVQSSASGSTAAGADQNGLQLEQGQTIHANLEHSLDAKKCKPGDPVEARTTEDMKQDGNVVLKKGARLHGHVTEAQARSKGNAESSLGVVFDSVETKKGGEMPMHLGIQALAAPSSQTATSLNDDGGMLGSSGGGAGSARASGGGGLLGGARGTVGGATSVAGNATGSLEGNAGHAVDGTVGATTRTAGGATTNIGGLNAAGQLTSGSRGVFGLQGLTLASTTSSATQASVVSSTSRNVHLDSGTQMELAAIAQR
jgi:hypothetical protein